MTTNHEMDEKSCHPTTMNSQRVTVKIPDGLPALMMIVTRELIRHCPEDECTAYSIAANCLEEMLKENHGKTASSTDNEWAREIIALNVIKMVEKYGVTTKTANDAATLIQRTWRKYNKPVSKSKHDSLGTGDHVFSKELQEDTYEEMKYENDSDDMERVNVVRKGQRDYVPPIPDFIDDLFSLKYEENVNSQSKDISYEDEEYNLNNL